MKNQSEEKDKDEVKEEAEDPHLLPLFPKKVDNGFSPLEKFVSVSPNTILLGAASGGGMRELRPSKHVQTPSDYQIN